MTRVWLTCAAACLCPFWFAARLMHGSAVTFKVGMASRTFAPKGPYNWRGAKTHGLLTTVWYPALPSADEQPLSVPGLSQIFELGSVASNAAFPASPAQFPLIALSHGTGGSALSLAWFGEALAARGYIVAAVNHPGNNATEPYTAEGFSTWWERAKDLSVVIDNMLADPEFGRRIDASRIGAAGFSLGGCTMIEIAGGRTDPAAYLEFCASARADAICKSPPEFPTLAEDFKRMSASNPEFQAELRHARDSYRDPRVRAVFAMAPALGPAFRPESLKQISIPVEIVAGQGDRNVPIASSAEYFRANIPGAKLKIFPGQVGHYTFLDSCPQHGAKLPPLLCQDEAGVDRDEVHKRAVELAAQFFQANLR
ncbi:MAG TPA: alpha/beta hydrolase [Candidatus Cybelea sp.]|nr:alpha/beta hydrolase [Candidatus Cybelea sp.]